MEENNLGPNSNFIPKIFAGANDKNNKAPKDIEDKDLREAAEKKEDKTVKQKSKNGMNYGVSQTKATPKFTMNNIFQKGKDKVYGAVDLLKSKID
tara:strand:- start:166 stop:450 length:285 start_codon:yes stop_codon:yes gene_type:complete